MHMELAAPWGAPVVWLAAAVGDPWQGNPEGPLDNATSSSLATKIQTLLSVAAVEGCTILILGAWGCGAARFPVVCVAQAFREALHSHGSAFDRVVFAIPPSHVARVFDRELRGL